MNNAAPESGRKLSWLHFIYILLIFGVIGCISILASVPPVSRDALTHHLAIPKLYLQHGGIYEIPYLYFTYFPMNLDLLYTVSLYFNNDISAKFIHFSFALTTAALIYRYLRRRISMEFALLGSLFFLSIPVIVRLSSTVYVDLGLICFLFTSLLFLFHWIESGFQFKYLIVSGIFCGLALGTKYNGLIGLFLLGLFIPFVYSRYHAEQKFYFVKSIGWSALFVVVALAVFSPWMIRNALWTGNPIYPLYNNILIPHSLSDEPVVDTVVEEQTQMSNIAIRRNIYGESWMEIILLPLRPFFQGEDDNPRYFDGKINPFLLFLPIFSFWGLRSMNRQEKTEKLMMLFFSIFFLLYACAQTVTRIRYFSPILPPLIVLSMFGLSNIKTAILDRSFRVPLPLKMVLIYGIIFAMIGLNAIYMIDRFKRDQPLVYITGKVTRDQYIQAYRPEYASFQYANKNLPKDSKILGLYVGDRGYYSNIHIEFSLEMIQKFASVSDSGKDIAKKLQERGFTHLIVNFPLFNFWVQKYSLHERKMLKDFFDNYTFTEFTKDDYGILKLKP